MKTPFLWAGSKDRDYKLIKNYIPSFSTYYEPFLGGGAVYFRLLADRGTFKAHCSDIHEDLICVYEAMRDDPEGLISGLPQDKDRTIFNALLASTPTAPTERAARFLYLNRNRFFGLGGWMNADRYARDAVVERIRFFHPLMQETVFSSKGCWSLPTAEEGDFVFCDPPYPETNNAACYKVDDEAVWKLNCDFYDHVYNTQASFFWVTKHSAAFEDHSNRSDVIIEKRTWHYRKPGKGVQEAHELYAYR